MATSLFFYVFYGKIYMYPKTFELPKIFTQAYFFAYFRGNLGACEKIIVVLSGKKIFILMKNFICDIFNEP